jgi:hypothetical protein
LPFEGWNHPVRTDMLEAQASGPLTSHAPRGLNRLGAIEVQPIPEGSWASGVFNPSGQGPHPCGCPAQGEARCGR